MLERLLFIINIGRTYMLVCIFFHISLWIYRVLGIYLHEKHNITNFL